MLDIAMPGEAVPNQIVVVAETPLAQKEVPVLAKRLGAIVRREIQETGMHLLELRGTDATATALKEIEKLGAPIHAYPNYKMSIPAPPGVMAQLMGREGPVAKPMPARKSGPLPSGEASTALYTTDDPSVSNQYWLWLVKEPFCKAPATAVKNIAIIDTGVDYNHPDLAGKVVKGWDYVNWDNDPMDENGNGTHCAGIAAATAGNGLGTRGVSPNSTIYAYRVLDENGSGTFFNVVAAIRKAANNADIHVLSLSLLGYLTEGSTAYDDLKAVIDYAVVTKGKIVVAAAGNEGNKDAFEKQHAGEKTRPVPAWYPNSFTVGASTETDYRAYFSNYDVSNVKSDDETATYTFNFVDIVAPGVSILSTYLADQYVQISGTSTAAGLVAGACARLWDHNTAWTRSQVTARLIDTGVSLGPARGFPVVQKRLDLFEAVGGPSISGGFMGQVVHGEEGHGLSGVKVEALDGGEVKGTSRTNRGGFYFFRSLNPTTSYALRFSRNGFVERTVAVGTPLAGTLKDLKVEFVAPSRATDSQYENWRIIVYWKSNEPGSYDFAYDNDNVDRSGEHPFYPYHFDNAAGMEANAYLRTPTRGTISYRFPGSLSESPYVAFKHESWMSTPMEAHVIRNQESGTYKYWLRLDPADWGWGTIKFSSGTPNFPMYPVVVVYKGDTLVKTISSYNATRAGSTQTKYWHVFNLSGDTVSVVNKIQNVSP
jgi:subtilisin family serine protease